MLRCASGVKVCELSKINISLNKAEILRNGFFASTLHVADPSFCTAKSVKKLSVSSMYGFGFSSENSMYNYFNLCSYLIPEDCNGEQTIEFLFNDQQIVIDQTFRHNHLATLPHLLRSAFLRTKQKNVNT